MFELVFFILLCLFLECGIGTVYGIGVGYDPIIVYPAAIILNYISIIIVISVIDRLLKWRPTLKRWLEGKLARGRKIIDKYGYLGILLGVVVLSPIQLAVVGRLLGLKSTRLYLSLIGAVTLVATIYLAVSLGIFKILLN